MASNTNMHVHNAKRYIRSLLRLIFQSVYFIILAFVKIDDGAISNLVDCDYTERWTEGNINTNQDSFYL